MDISPYINGPGWPLTYNADGVASVHNCDFINAPLFKEAYAAAAKTPHTFGPDLHIEWRVFVCCWAATQAIHLHADFVECGVFTGIFSSAVMRYIDFANRPERTFYLLDTYSGIPEEQINADESRLGIQGHNRFYSDCYEAALKTFAPYPNARIIRGRIPETLEQIDSARIGYVSMDLNIVEPEMAAAEYLWPRMVSGAIIVLDDYGWRPHINQKHAWDAFAAKHGLMVLALPTGQGLLVKP
jgi:O-methyltransferase